MRKGVLDNRFDRAWRYGTITGLVNTNEALQEAIDTILSGVGSIGTQQDITNYHGIPLQSIEPFKLGTDYAHVELSYFRTPFSGGFNQQGELFMRARGTTRAEDWYRLPFTQVSTPGGKSTEPAFTQGRPSGDLIFPNGGAVDSPKPGPVTYTWTQPGIKFLIPFDLDHSPGPAVAGLKGRTNESAVTFGGIPIAANHIRFDDWTMDVITANGQNHWQGHYEFTVVRGGFFLQTAFYDTSTTPGLWQTVDGYQYETADFNGAFET